MFHKKLEQILNHIFFKFIFFGGGWGVIDGLLLKRTEMYAWCLNRDGFLFFFFLLATDLNSYFSTSKVIELKHFFFKYMHIYILLENITEKDKSYPFSAVGCLMKSIPF